MTGDARGQLSVVVLVALAVLALALIALLILWLRRRLRARRTARRIEASLVAAAQAETSPSALGAAVAALEAQLGSALAEVRASALGDPARGPAYALPWYLVLGAQGAGKRSALRATGMSFAHMDVGAAGDVACWLASEALVLTTDGRFGDDDRHGWLALLDVLRRVRPRRPLDAVVLVVSIETLMQGEGAALDASAQLLRARLRAVTTRLGMIVPVYLVLTQCDRLPGFRDTFRDLTRTEQRQVWGFTLPSQTQGAERDALVASRLTRLVQVLERRAVGRIAELEALDERVRVHALPATLAALGEPLRQLMARVFVQEASGEGPVARGVYLTSVPPREPARASTLDLRDDGLVAQVADADEARDGFFLGALFREVVIPDGSLATTSRAVRRRRRLVALTGALALASLAVGIAWLPARAYLHHRRTLAGLRVALQRVLPQRAARDEALAALDPLRAATRNLLESAGQQGPKLNLGLDRGEALRADVGALYAASMRRLLIAPYVKRTAAALEAMRDAHAWPAKPPSAAEHARAYTLLKSYLLLTREIDGLSAPLLSHAGWLARQLVEQLSDSSSEAGASGDHAAADGRRERLRAHVDTYLALLSTRSELSMVRDGQVVAGARALLGRVSDVQLALDRIESELDPLNLGHSLDTLVGATALPLTSSRPVPGAYTRRAWETHVRALLDAPPAALLGESWVLSETATTDGGEASDAARRCALRAGYFARYIDSWQQFLAGLRLRAPRDGAETLSTLQALTRGQPPPLEQLAREVFRESQLELAASPSAAPDDGVLRRLARTLGTTAAPSASAGAACAEGQLVHTSVRAALRGFYLFGVSEPQPGADAAQAAKQVTAARLYHEQLAFVRDGLEARAVEPAQDEPLLERITQASSTIRQLIDAQEVGWRPRFEALLWPPIDAARATTGDDLARAKSAAWCSAVVLPFARTLRDRYPFVRTGQDASLADLQAFYAPDAGMLWEAYAATLARDVPRTGDRYEVRRGSPVARMYLPQLPQFLARSQGVARALFPSPGEPARVDFELRIRPTPGIATITLSVDGQRVELHNGPDRWVPLRWPGGGDAHGAELRVRGAGIDERIAQEGAWGLFRLLESGRAESADDGRWFSVRFRLRTQRDVILDLRPARAESPLMGASGRLLEVFRAPGVEVPRAITRGARACR